MIIGELVTKQRTHQARVALIAAASRGSTTTSDDDASRFARRATDAAVKTAERRGVEPAVRSASTMIVFDQRGLDRRQVVDRRQSSVKAEPSSEFVAQAMAHEGMLLDLRPDPQQTRQAGAVYRETNRGDAATPFEGYDFEV